MKTRYATLGVLCIVVAIGVALAVLYGSRAQERSLVFSESNLLGSLWRAYATEYHEAGSGRTLDKQRENITTSEGQAYSMLRAVWVDDKEQFDASWNWARTNLQRRDDKLFSWLYGQRPDGSYGILTEQGGENAATDGDVDIALALIFAYERWQDPAYLDAARAIIADIWRHETVVVRGERIVVANNLEQHDPDSVLVNPSYLAPYAYRAFAVVDPERDWMSVVDSSYALIERSMTQSLDRSSAGLPPDWIEIQRATGELRAPSAAGLTTVYGFEAIRLPWRLALDWQWHAEPRAKAALEKMRFLGDRWRTDRRIAATYAHDGSSPAEYESVAGYGGAIGYFMVIEPELAKEIYREKLESLFDPDTRTWRRTLGYYDDNWAWFGIGLYNGLLANLTPQQ